MPHVSSVHTFGQNSETFRMLAEIFRKSPYQLKPRHPNNLTPLYSYGGFYNSLLTILL